MVSRLSLALVLALASCSSAPVSPGAFGPPASDRLQTGSWGGEHIALTVTGAGGHLEFDCASGDITQPLVVDDLGRLDAGGVFVQEHAGPIRVGEEPDRKPARYSGHLTGKTLILTVTLVDSNESIGSFTLTYAAEPRIRKCL